MDVAELDGTIVVVTGAGQGIGAAVVRHFAAVGAAVVATDRNAGTADELAAELCDVGHDVVAHPLDVRDPAAVDALVAEVERTSGPIDVLVNVAGVLRTGPVAECSDEDWTEAFAVNTGGVFHCSRAVARRMIPRRAGVIVTVSSNAAGVPRTGMAAYAASKAAASMFTKCLGLELAPHGIRCNVVSPGSTDTPMQRAMWTAGDGAASVISGSLATFKTGIPLGRLADPADVAEAVVFLASDRARHITMHDLYVDGGATLRA